MNQELKCLEEKIGYTFRDRNLLKQAMIHSSYANERQLPKYACNERLEFLGDAVLELVSSEFLFSEHKTMPEGELTKTRASMVCEPSLAFCARELGLGGYLLLGKGEDATGGRQRESITSDAMEALIGAIYLDGGIGEAGNFIREHLLKDVEDKSLFYDAKTILQEMVQSEGGGQLRYQLVRETGPDHNKEFTVETHIGDRTYAVGVGKTKKGAEQVAAYQTILLLKKQQQS